MQGLRARASRAADAAVGRLGGAAEAVETAWSDRGYRWLAVVAVTSFWLLLALRDIAFLVTFALSAACLWWRRRKHRPVDEEADDWY
jgi:hypothetical protein